MEENTMPVDTIQSEQLPKENEAEEIREVCDCRQQEPQENDDTSEIKIPVKFNKQKMMLSCDEASVLAQKGMKFDKMKNTLDKLSYLGAVNGQSTDEYIDSLIAKREEEIQSIARQQANGDEELYKKLIELEHYENQSAYEKISNAKQNENVSDNSDELERLADEFIELKERVPSISSLDDVSDEVVKIAAESGICLFDAYLRHEFFEKQSIERAIDDQKNAKNSSTGSQSSAVSAAQNLEDALLKGIWK